jgi:hypothetical protein
MKTLAVALGAGLALMAWAARATEGDQKGNKVETRVFELRTYYAAPGQMQALHARFRNHTNKLFEKHGMTLIGFWSPLDSAEAEQKLVYILAFPSKEGADKSWEGFRNDPEWKKAREASEVNGKLVERVESVFMKATDYSPLK